jgi:hypothetical protein
METETLCSLGVLTCCAGVALVALVGLPGRPPVGKLFIPDAVVANDLDQGRADAKRWAERITKLRLTRIAQELDDPAD